MANSRRRLPTTLIAGSLGVLLAIEVTGIALARSNPVVVVEAATAPGPAEMATDAGVGLGSALGQAIGSASTVGTGPIVEGLRSASALTTFVAPAAQPRKAPIKAMKPKARPAAHATTTGFHGRSHVWIPSLGISRELQSFPCSRQRPPDAGVYHWGCAGRNNVYLLSHAWSTFKPLHDAYVHGRLRKGMQVWYANANGTVHQYRVIWWKVTLPTTAASWAWAGQSRPSMTLQTCVGSKSQYRLMVRLVQVG
jgi:hypothetical protein